MLLPIGGHFLEHVIHAVNEHQLRRGIRFGQPFRIVDTDLNIGGPLEDQNGHLELGDFSRRVVFEPRDQVRLHARPE